MTHEPSILLAHPRLHQCILRVQCRRDMPRFCGSVDDRPCNTTGQAFDISPSSNSFGDFEKKRSEVTYERRQRKKKGPAADVSRISVGRRLDRLADSHGQRCFKANTHAPPLPPRLSTKIPKSTTSPPPTCRRRAVSSSPSSCSPSSSAAPPAPSPSPPPPPS